MPTHTQPNAPDSGFAYFFENPARDYYIAWKPGPGYREEVVTMASEAIASVRTNDNLQQLRGKGEGGPSRWRAQQAGGTARRW